jgi:hypothetical protein
MVHQSVTRILLVLISAVTVAAAAACSSPTEPSPELKGGVVAVFDVSGERFSVFVRNSEAAQRLIRIRNGENFGQIPNGRILRGAGVANHNAPHAWHLDPDDISIVDAAIEVCDGRPSYVDENIAEYVDVVGRYCPWGAKLVRVEDYR